MLQNLLRNDYGSDCRGRETKRGKERSNLLLAPSVMAKCNHHANQ